MSDTITQKETATDFLRLTARGQVDDAVARGGAGFPAPCGGGGGMEPATVRILRFEDGRIAEMWDIARAAPVPMANRDGIF
jgi:hypothetical protein